LRLPLREDSSTIIISRHIARQLAILRLFQTMKQPKNLTYYLNREQFACA